MKKESLLHRPATVPESIAQLAASLNSKVILLAARPETDYRLLEILTSRSQKKAVCFRGQPCKNLQIPERPEDSFHAYSSKYKVT